MEIFDVHRRDVYNFDDYMDLKKPAYGGPSSGKSLKDNKGNHVNKDRKLEEYQRTVKRHDAFGNHVYDPTYKAMGGDLVHKQDNKGKNPYNYPDSYDEMGIPVVDVGDSGKPSKTNEGFCNTDFSSFILESAAIEEEEEECDCEKENE